jgi:copper(I)-binding protein
MLRGLMIAGLLWLVQTSGTQAAELQLVQGEIRLPMPGRTVTAGYVSLQNQSPEMQELVAASSPVFERIELHTHIEQDGMMRMVEVESIELEPGATLLMQPGGLHLMLFEPLHSLALGEMVPIQLRFTSGRVLQLELPVTAMPIR